MSSAEESKWSGLPAGILNSIADLLKTNGDENITSTISVPVTTIRSVCKTWRSSILPPTPAITTILVPSLTQPNNTLTLSLNTVYLLHQPPSLSSSSASKPTYWFLRVENTNDLNKFRVLNPLYHADKLPESFLRSINLLIYRISHIYSSYILSSKSHLLQLFGLERVVVSTSRPLVAVAIFRRKLYSLRIGDDVHWKAVEEDWVMEYCDVVFSKGKFYAVDVNGRTVSIGGRNFTRASEIVSRLRTSRYIHGNGYYKRLVESKGEVFLVDRYECDGEYRKNTALDADYKFFHVTIYKLNRRRREWKGVNSLDGHVFFVGDDCSYSLSAGDFPGLEPNFVYMYDGSYSKVNDVVMHEGEFVGPIGVYSLNQRECKALAGFSNHWSLFCPPKIGSASSEI